MYSTLKKDGDIYLYHLQMMLSVKRKFMGFIKALPQQNSLKDVESYRWFKKQINLTIKQSKISPDTSTQL
jgi:hypothetical protein